MALVVTMTAGDARENYKTGTEGSRKCGDRIRASHPVAFSCPPNDIFDIWAVATACEVLGNLLDAVLPRLPRPSDSVPSHLLVLHLLERIFPSALLGPAFAPSPCLPLCSEGTCHAHGLKCQFCAGDRFPSVPWIPHSPQTSLLDLTSWFPLPTRHFHLGVLLSSQTKHA